MSHDMQRPQIHTPPRLPWPLAIFIGIALTLIVWVLESFLLRSSFLDAHPLLQSGLRVALYAAPLLLVLALFLARVVWKRKTRWLSLAVGMLLPWLAITWLLFGDEIGGYIQRTEFDSAAWRAAAPRQGALDPEEARMDMVHELMESGRLDGRTKAELLELLGPDDGPEGTSFRQHPPFGDRWDTTYVLGRTRGFIGFGNDWLAIKFDEAGRVQHYIVRTDD